MLAKEQLREILAEPELTKTDRLLLLLAFEPEAPKPPQKIKELAVELGCSEIRAENVSAFLRAARPKVVNLKEGWLLTARGRNYVGTLVGSQQNGDEALFDRIDREIIAALKKQVVSAACSYEQALRDLADANRASYRGPATDMREALRETLDHLAPDKQVVAMPGYKQEADVVGPTMRQKVRFVFSNRGAGAKPDATEAAVKIVDEIVGSFVRYVYTRSNVSTHTSTGRDEVLRLRHYVRVALIEILKLKC